MFSLVFLFAFIGVVVVATVLTELEYFGWATALLLATVLGAQFLHILPVFDWVSTHATETVTYALLYVAAGIIWSFVKWFSFLIQFRDRYREQKEAFLTKKGLDTKLPVPENLREEFGTFLGPRWISQFRGNSLTEKPKASNNKSRIINWMSLWPCSVVGTLLNDPIRRIFDFLFSYFKSLYQKLADYVFRNDVELK